MRARAAALVVALAVPVLGSAAGAAPALHSDDVTTKVPGSITQLRVDGDISNVTLTPGRESSVKAHLEWTTERPEVKVSASRGVLTVTARCNDGLDAGTVHIGGLHSCVDDLHIVVPSSASLDVETGEGISASRFTGVTDLRGGTVTVTDLKAPRVRLKGLFGVTARGVAAPVVSLSSSSGTLSADRVTARTVTMTASNGTVRGTQLSAQDVVASSSSGDVALTRVTADTVRGSTKNGRVTAAEVKSRRASLSSSSGDVSAQRLVAATLDISTANGRVTLLDTTATRTEAKSNAGDVTVSRLRGQRADASSANGNVTVTDVHLRVISVHSSSGNLAVQDLDAPDVVKATSNNGSVHVRVPTGRYYVDARSSNGSVHIDGLTLDRWAVREITATSGSGDVTVTGV